MSLTTLGEVPRSVSRLSIVAVATISDDYVIANFSIFLLEKEKLIKQSPRVLIKTVI